MFCLDVPNFFIALYKNKEILLFKLPSSKPTENSSLHFDFNTKNKHMDTKIAGLNHKIEMRYRVVIDSRLKLKPHDQLCENSVLESLLYTD